MLPKSRLVPDLDLSEDGERFGHLRMPHSSNLSAYGQDPIPITVVHRGIADAAERCSVPLISSELGGGGLGNSGQAGRPAPMIHQPVVERFAAPGGVVCQGSKGRVQHGDCLCHVARDCVA